MQLENFISKKKLQTYFIHSLGHKSAHVQIWFKAGSALEENDEKGMAHFLEHMFFKGTKKRPNQKIAKEVETFGGEINAFTSFNYTCYYINAPIDKILESTDILLDMVSNPMFLEKDLIPERDVVFEEYRRSIDSPNQFAFIQLQKNCFSPPYNSPILGNEKTIKSFSKKMLQDFRNKYYNTSNCFLIISGDLTKYKTKLQNTISKYQISKKKNPTNFPHFQLKTNSTVNIHSKKVKMAQIYLTFFAEGPQKESMPAEDLAINCLGLGESSLPYKTLVIEKMHANDFSSSTLYFTSSGVHIMKVSCPPENLQLIYKELLQVLKQFVENGPTSDELQKIKNQYSASKIYEKESLESYSFSIGHGLALSNDAFYDDKHLESIKKISLFEVRKALKNIFSRKVQISLQIPEELEIKKAKEDLHNFLNNFEKWQISLNQSEKKSYKSSSLKTDPSCKIFSMAPGITFLHRKNNLTPTFALQCYLEGGLSKESQNTAGIHNFLSSILTKGYSDLDYNKIKIFLEERSATLNGFSGKNTYGLSLHGQTEHFEELKNHFFMSLNQPSYPKNMIDLERELLSRTYLSHKEDPAKQCFKKFNQIIFAHNNYSLDLIGNENTINFFTKENLEALHKRTLDQSNILISYCGNLEADEVLGIIGPNISSFRPRKNPTILPTKKSSFSSLKNLPSAFIPFDREQTSIIIGFLGKSIFEKEDIFLRILTSLLSGQSSELFLTVRDKLGLCYSVSPIHVSAIESGYWGIYMASGHDKVTSAIKAINQILNRIKEKGLNRSELKFVKEMLNGQFKTALVSNEDYVNNYSFYQFFNLGADFYFKMNEQIQKTKLEELNKFLKVFLSQPQVEIIVGKKKS